MMENGRPRKRRQLSPEEKWEIFLEVTSQEISQADAARKWGVDVSTVIRIRQLARDAPWRRSRPPSREDGHRRRSRWSWRRRWPRTIAYRKR